MKSFTIKATVLVLGLGIALALPWILAGGSAPAIAAPAPSVTESHVKAPNIPAAELHVCPSGCPYSSIQDAVDAANPSDVIKVAAGTYTGVNNRGGLAQVVYINRSVTIRGGYTIAFTDPPDPDANPTTLDAQGQGRVLYITGDINPTVEGLRITGGDATGLGGSPRGGDAGGGVYVVNATVTISGNQVFNNTADIGSGLFLLDGDNATVSDNIVFFNTADDGGGLLLQDCDNATLNGNTITSNTGGGLTLWGGGDATISDNIVTSNTGDVGGGLHMNDSSATITGNTVSSNTAHIRGGGVYLESSDAIVSENIIFSNTAYEAGGGLAQWDGGVTLNGNTVTSNTAAAGGGLYLTSSDATLNGNTISANAANGIGSWNGGGGLYTSWSNVTMTNDVIADNRASTAGSGVYIDFSVHLLHTTIAHNSGGDGSGVYVTGGYGTVALTNTILVSHTVGIYVTGGNTARLEGTLWGSGSWANDTDWGGDGTIITGTVNVWGDPDFVDPDSGDYHIGTNSAAVDAGVGAGVDDDIDGEDRPFDGDRDGVAEFDIGADELVPHLDVIKQATPDPVQPGAQLTYTIQIANTGNMELHATITDTLPFSVTLGGTSGGTLIPPGGTVILPNGRVAVTWTAVIIEPGGLWTGTIVVTVDEGQEGPLTNQVEVTTREGAAGQAIAIVNARKVYLPLVLRNN